MKHMRVVLIFLICSVVLLAAVQKKKIEPGAVNEKVVRVLGDNAWTDTGLLLREKDRVAIKADGIVYSTMARIVQVSIQTDITGQTTKAITSLWILPSAEILMIPGTMPP